MAEEADGEGEGRNEKVDEGQQDKADQLDVVPQHHRPVAAQIEIFDLFSMMMGIANLLQEQARSIADQNLQQNVYQTSNPDQFSLPPSLC